MWGVVGRRYGCSVGVIPTTCQPPVNNTRTLSLCHPTNPNPPIQAAVSLEEPDHHLKEIALAEILLDILLCLSWIGVSSARLVVGVCTHTVMLFSQCSAMAMMMEVATRIRSIKLDFSDR